MGSQRYVTLGPDHPLTIGHTQAGLLRGQDSPNLTYCAYLPDKMRELGGLSDEALAECERASDFVVRAGEYCAKSGVGDAMAQLLLCIKAVSTVCAEYYTTTCTKTLDYAAAIASGCSSPDAKHEAIALDTIDALRSFTAGAHETLTREELIAVNAAITRSNHTADLCGKVRDRPVWIGRNILDARYVAPPEDTLDEYVDDIVQSLNDDTWPVNSMARSALAHLQLVSVHPFVDGNGRVGRALWLRMLQRDGSAGGLVIPATAPLLMRWPGYIYALEAARSTDGPADPSEFVRLAAWCCGMASGKTMRLTAYVRHLLREWPGRIPEMGSVTSEALAAFTATPLMTQAMLQDKLSCDVSAVLKRLVEAGILQRRRSKYCDADVYVAHELLRAVENFQTMHGYPKQVDWID